MYENKLMEIIDENLDVDEKEEKKFVIDSDIKADWALDKISEIQKEFNRISEVTEEKIAVMKMTLEKGKERMESSRSFFESKLREYFETVDKRETKTQLSYKLPSGSLKMRKEKLDFNRNDKKLLEYAKENNLKELVRTTERFAWGDFKEKLAIQGNSIVNKETGEIIDIDGLDVEERPGQFKVEVE